jgi:hypothetical protein
MRAPGRRVAPPAFRVPLAVRLPAPSAAADPSSPPMPANCLATPDLLAAARYRLTPVHRRVPMGMWPNANGDDGEILVGWGARSVMIEEGKR